MPQDDPNPYRDAAGGASAQRRRRIKTFTIPSCGPVVLYGPEIEIVDTRAFQRLAGIKQLGSTYVAYRGAVHTRFAHSLGTLFVTEQILQSIARNPRNPEIVPDRARRLARLFALLHDLPHIPFGHTLEDEFQLLKRHDENQARINRLMKRDGSGGIAGILTDHLGQDELDEFLRVVSAKTNDEIAKLDYPYVADVVGNTVCADMLDYIRRDLEACGMPVAVGDRFMEFFTVTKDTETQEVNRRRMVLNLEKRGMPRPDVESEVVKLLSYRYELAERVYFHHSKNAASVMIGRAVQALGLATGPKAGQPGVFDSALDKNFDSLTDEALLMALAHPEVASALGLQLPAVSARQRKLAVDLAAGVLDHRLYKIAYLAVHDDIPDRIEDLYVGLGDPVARRDLEDRMARSAGLKEGGVLIHIPRPKMMEKRADVRVRTTDGDVVTLAEFDRRHSRRIQALNDAHTRLWRVTVYVHPNAKDRSVRFVRALAQDKFRAQARYVPGKEVEARLLNYVNELFDLNAEAEEWFPADREATRRVAALDYGSSEADALVHLRAQIHLLRRSR